MKNRDYLKYFRIIRYYIKRKYDIGLPQLEMLLFLNSEGKFSRDIYRKYDELLSWNPARFNKLLKDGWVDKFRNQKGKQKALYEVSYKTKRMIDSVYDKLEGGRIPMSHHNPMFKKKVKYTDKVYRNYIKDINQPPPPHRSR